MFSICIFWSSALFPLRYILWYNAGFFLHINWFSHQIIWDIVNLPVFMYLLWSFCFEDDYVMQQLCLFMSLYWSLNYYAQDNLEKMFFPTNVLILVQETSDLIRSNKTRNLLLTRLYAMVCTLYLSALSKTSGFNILSSWYLALGNYWKGTNGFGIMLIDPQFIQRWLV